MYQRVPAVANTHIIDVDLIFVRSTTATILSTYFRFIDFFGIGNNIWQEFTRIICFVAIETKILPVSENGWSLFTVEPGCVESTTPTVINV